MEHEGVSYQLELEYGEGECEDYPELHRIISLQVVEHGEQGITMESFASNESIWNKKFANEALHNIVEKVHAQCICLHYSVLSMHFLHITDAFNCILVHIFNVLACVLLCR